MILKTAVYSLKIGSWKILGKDCSLDCKYSSWPQEAGVIVNYALHWRTCGCDEGDVWKIIAFDLVKEGFHVVPVSERMKFHDFMKLSVLDGWVPCYDL